MKHRWFRIPFSESLSFRALVESAFADAFASLEPKPDSRSEAARDRSRRGKARRAKGWPAWAKRRAGDSLA